MNKREYSPFSLAARLTAIDADLSTFETLPTEVLLQILRYLLRKSEDIDLRPIQVELVEDEGGEYDADWDFGILGILRVSKHLSDLALGVLYGENTYQISEYCFAVDSRYYDMGLWDELVSHLSFGQCEDLGLI